MKDWPVLTTIMLLPLIGAFFVSIIKGEDEAALRNIRWAALWTTLDHLCGLARARRAIRPHEHRISIRGKAAMAQRHDFLLCRP